MSILTDYIKRVNLQLSKEDKVPPLSRMTQEGIDKLNQFLEADSDDENVWQDGEATVSEAEATLENIRIIKFEVKRFATANGFACE